MAGAGRDELAQTVLTQAPEAERVNKGRHHIQPGMGDQRLPRRGDRKGRKNSGNLGHQKGASFSRQKSASTTLFSQLRSTFRRLNTPDERHPHENPGLALAGDHDDSKIAVAGFLDRLGYDPVDAGPIAAGRAFQPGTEIFNGSHTADQLDTLLAEACAPARA
uniref:Uncharacterized protein n=1 Tax=Arthrobacter sp. J3.37 TaxID=347208 RepID=I3W0R5_9MICC|nr:hypothetical protein [Arthrobacter sp. J3.37]AFK89192.1 hypothetical protein [Arthrobacter sp. J3.37]